MIFCLIVSPAVLWMEVEKHWRGGEGRQDPKREEKKGFLRLSIFVHEKF